MPAFQRTSADLLAQLSVSVKIDSNGGFSRLTDRQYVFYPAEYGERAF
jgi:hypothetical protein